MYFCVVSLFFLVVIGVIVVLVGIGGLVVLVVLVSSSLWLVLLFLLSFV